MQIKNKENMLLLSYLCSHCELWKDRAKAIRLLTYEVQTSWRKSEEKHNTKQKRKIYNQG